MNSISNRLKKMRNRKGFTLVELIVVIVIIGILAAVLIPRLTGFTDRAHRTQALVWAKEVATVMDADNAEDGAYPTNAGDVASEAGITFTSGSSLTIDGDGQGGFQVTYHHGTTNYRAGRASGTASVTEE